MVGRLPRGQRTTPGSLSSRTRGRKTPTGHAPPASRNVLASPDARATSTTTLTTTTTPRLSLRTSPRSFARKLVSLTTTYSEALEGGTPLISVPSTGSPVAATLTMSTTTTTNCGRRLTSPAVSPYFFGLAPVAVSLTSTMYSSSPPPADPTAAVQRPRTAPTHTHSCCRSGHPSRRAWRILQHPRAKDNRRWGTARRHRHHRRTWLRGLVGPAQKEGRTTARLLFSPHYEGLQLLENSHKSSSINDCSSDYRRSSERCRSSAPTGLPQQQRAPMR